MIWQPCLSGVYEVSDTGLVRRREPPRAGRLLSQSLVSGGYWRVSACVNGRELTCPVHRLVAEAFLGPCPPGMCVNHKDGCKQNNYPSNLEYVTPAGNSRHAMLMGLCPSGERHGRYTAPHRTARGERVNTCRLTEADVRLARMLRADGWTLPRLCIRFGLSKSAMHALCTRKNWGHVA